MPETSIIMTAYRRADLLANTLESIYRQTFKDFEVIVVEDGDDGGAIRQLCERYGLRYFQRKNRPDVLFSNPAIPTNIGIRRAEGEVVIIQNAECLHHSPELIEALTAPHRTEKNLAVFASVSARSPDGTHWHWYVHPEKDCRKRPFFFCGSVRREHIWRVQGLCEALPAYGYDDDILALQLQRIGVKFCFPGDIIAHHQWHTATGCWGIQKNQEIFREIMDKFMRHELPIETNAGREWGSLDS